MDLDSCWHCFSSDNGVTHHIKRGCVLCESFLARISALWSLVCFGKQWRSFYHNIKYHKSKNFTRKHFVSLLGVIVQPQEILPLDWIELDFLLGLGVAKKIRLKNVNLFHAPDKTRFPLPPSMGTQVCYTRTTHKISAFKTAISPMSEEWEHLGTWKKNTLYQDRFYCLLCSTYLSEYLFSLSFICS